MAWIKVDDFTGERILDGQGGQLVIAVDGANYKLDLLTSTRATLWEDLRPILCRAEPLDGADPVAPPEDTDPPPPAASQSDDPTFEQERVEQERTAALNTVRDTYNLADLPTAVQLDHLTGDHGPAVRPIEPDAETRAEELLEQHWSVAKVADITGLSLHQVREISRELAGVKR